MEKPLSRRRKGVGLIESMSLWIILNRCWKAQSVIIALAANVISWVYTPLLLIPRDFFNTFRFLSNCEIESAGCLLQPPVSCDCRFYFVFSLSIRFKLAFDLNNKGVKWEWTRLACRLLLRKKERGIAQHRTVVGEDFHPSLGAGSRQHFWIIKHGVCSMKKTEKKTKKRERERSQQYRVGVENH